MSSLSYCRLGFHNLFKSSWNWGTEKKLNELQGTRLFFQLGAL